MEHGVVGGEGNERKQHTCGWSADEGRPIGRMLQLVYKMIQLGA